MSQSNEFALAPRCTTGALDLHKANCSWTLLFNINSQSHSPRFFKFCPKLLSGVTGLQAKAQCSFFGNLRSHVFTLKSFVSLFVFLFICLFIKHVVLCFVCVFNLSEGPWCKLHKGGSWAGVEWRERGNVRSYVSPTHSSPQPPGGGKQLCLEHSVYAASTFSS